MTIVFPTSSGTPTSYWEISGGVWTDRTPLAGDDDGVANVQIVQPGWLHECTRHGELNDAGTTVLLLRGSDEAATFDFVRGGLTTLLSLGGEFTSSASP
jgi:hypothetical protein